MRDEFLAAANVNLLVVRDFLELSVDNLVEFVLDRNAERELQSASGVLPAPNALGYSVEFNLDELVLELFGCRRWGLIIRRLHGSPFKSDYGSFRYRNELRFRNTRYYLQIWLSIAKLQFVDQGHK